MKIELIQGNCLEEMERIQSNNIDLVLTDLPYGKTACKWDVVIPFEPMWKQLKRITKNNSAIILLGSEPFSSTLRISNIKMYKCEWYWKKERGTNFVQAKRYPMKVIENVIVFCSGTLIYNPKMRDVKEYKHVLPLPKKPNRSAQHMDSLSLDKFGNRIYKTYNKAYPINVLEIPRDNMSKSQSLHPTQKPIALMEYLIKTYTEDENEIVLDFAMSSGTTGVACKNLNRDFVGIEKNEEYFEIAKKRINSTTIKRVKP